MGQTDQFIRWLEIGLWVLFGIVFLLLCYLMYLAITGQIEEDDNTEPDLAMTMTVLAATGMWVPFRRPK